VDPVITGTGLVTGLGNGVDAAFDAFCRGETARHPLRAFDAHNYRTVHAYEIDDRPGGTDRPGRASQWLAAAVEQALTMAGHRPDVLASDRVAVIVGTGLAEQRSLELWHTAGAPADPATLHLGAGLGNPRPVTLVNACAAGLFALAAGADLLALGEADMVVVAASDSIAESMFGLLDRMNTHPPTEVRPFDVDRRGVILGEGAAAVVLENAASAAARGAPALAVLRGVATSCDAHHETAPLREGMAGTFRDAHHRARLHPDQIDLILLHGTGTALNDPTEALAMRDAFGPAVDRPLMTALKSLIGHTSGASGLMGLVVGVASLRTGLVPPTRHHTTAIPEVDGFRIVRSTVRAPLRTCQINAFGFGGVNAVALLSTEPGPAEPPPPASAPAEPPPPASAPAEVPVVVTGAGVFGPGLDSLPGLLAAARAGGARQKLGWQRAPQSGPPADIDARAVLGRRGLRYKDRATRLALCAVHHALADARLLTPLPGPLAADTGVVVASSFGIVESVCRVVAEIHTGGSGRTSPMDLPNLSGNVAAATVAIWYGLRGHNLTVSGGSTAGVEALALAAHAIRAGRVERMVVVGVEPAGERIAALVGTAIDPQARLFDGAAAVVLESEAAARARAASPVALLDSYACEATLERSADRGGAGPGDPVGDRTLWFLPCQHHASPPAVADGTAARTVDLSAVTGEATAALGVLQAAVAASWLPEGPGRRAVVSSGGCGGGGVATLSLRGLR
jgi:3-oxoacyl-[acyl-carrier-protein] synthase II